MATIPLLLSSPFVVAKMSQNCRNCKYSTEIKMQDEAMYTFKIDLFVNWGSGDNVFSVLHKD